MPGEIEGGEGDRVNGFEQLIVCNPSPTADEFRIVQTRTGAYQVDLGVPVPTKGDYNRREEFPLQQLAVGESFWIECGPWTAMYVYEAARKNRRGRAYQTRAETREGKRGLRVWRTA